MPVAGAGRPERPLNEDSAFPGSLEPTMDVRRSMPRSAVAVALVATCALPTGGSANSADPPTCLGRAATIVGAGEINGTTGDDVIVGSAGADRISALGGDDVVCDGAGADTVDLGEGDDTLSTHTARDPHDVLDGGPGADTVHYRRTKALKLTLGNTATDDGEYSEADQLLGFEGAIGGSGNDVLVGSDGPNTLLGGAGNDRITGGPGADFAGGQDGNDILAESDGGDAVDDIDGGPGIDEVSYGGRVEPVWIHLDGSHSSGRSGEGDGISGVENARGGQGFDHLYGTDGPNKLYAGGDIDVVYDGLGADTVDGGADCDYIVQPPQVDPGDLIRGGSGTCDYVSYTGRAVDVEVRLNTTAAVNGAVGEGDVLTGIESAVGGGGDDVVTGNGGFNVLEGGHGSDVLNGLGGSDTLLMSDGVSSNDVANCSYGYYDYASGDLGDSTSGCESVQLH